uniref:THAP domain-containing protein 1 n=1 Tax=Labrus bergylta TaxID=56723 RepID=A0A3Q3GVP5_9LABR
MAQSRRKCHCSVPYCSNNKQMHPFLSFHNFPSEDGLRARWVTPIRRDECAMFRILCGSTCVCSLHFDNEEIYSSQKGLRRLKWGVAPSRFVWNDWGRSQQGKMFQIIFKNVLKS